MLNFFAQSYTYTTTTTSTGSSAGLAAFFAIYLIVVLVIAVIAIIAMWKMFEKAGEQGWKAIVPFYNMWILFELSGKPGWWCLFILIPYLGSVIYFVLYCMAMIQLAKNFGKTTTFAVVGLILFNLVGFLILGFGKDKYVGGRYVSPSSTPTAA